MNVTFKLAPHVCVCGKGKRYPPVHRSRYQTLRIQAPNGTEPNLEPDGTRGRSIDRSIDSSIDSSICR